MKTMIKSSILAIGILSLSSIAFGQKKNETSAAVVYKNQFRPAMAKGQMDNAKKSLLEAKKFIDLAAEHPDTKNSQKTLYLKGEIYGSFIRVAAASKDSNFLKLGGDNPLETSIEAYKKGYPLGKKYKSDIKDAVTQQVILMSNLGSTMYSSENYKEAAEAFGYQAKYSDAIGVLDTSAIFNSALCNENIENYLEAAKSYEKVAKVNFRGTSSAVRASACYRKAGEIEKAKEIITEARVDNPTDRDLLLELVNTNIEAGDAAGAEKALTDAIATDPNNKQLYYTIGTIYNDLGDNEKAEAALNKALEIDPNYADAQYQLGAILVTWAGDLNTEARQMKLGDPNYEKTLQQSKDTYKRALIPLEAYIQNYPNDKAVLNILFQINRSLGDSTKALEYKKRADAL